MSKERLKKEFNVQIAIMLGFKKGKMKVNGKELPYEEQPWSYPKEWKHVIVGTPCWHLPDFIGMIEESVELRQKLGAIIKFDY